MSMLTALKDCYDRIATDEDSGIAPFGYTPEKVSFTLVLDRKGRLLEVVDLRDTAGKKPEPRIVQVPQSSKRPGTTPRSFFLWDKASLVLGVGAKPKDRSAERHAHRLAEEHAAFKAFHDHILGGTEDEGLCALLMFLERWAPARSTRWITRMICSRTRISSSASKVSAGTCMSGARRARSGPPT
jgi:CRISPR-associated protein Csd1